MELCVTGPMSSLGWSSVIRLVWGCRQVNKAGCVSWGTTHSCWAVSSKFTSSRARICNSLSWDPAQDRTSGFPWPLSWDQISLRTSPSWVLEPQTLWASEMPVLVHLHPMGWNKMSDNNLVQECVDFVRTVVLKSLRLEARCAQILAEEAVYPLCSTPAGSSHHRVLSCHALGTGPCLAFPRLWCHLCSCLRSVQLEIALLCVVLIQREARPPWVWNWPTSKLIPSAFFFLLSQKFKLVLYLMSLVGFIDIFKIT